MASHVWRLAMIVGLLGTIASVTFAQEPAPEVEVQFLELAGPLAERDSEISSLAWYGDELLLVTENPFIYRSEGNVGKFFSLDKADILDYLESDDPEPLQPQEVPIYGPDIENAVGGFEVAFDGFEGAVLVRDDSVFTDDLIFLTIEAETVDESDPSMRGYLVWGAVEGELDSIRLNLSDPVRLPTQTDHPNMSYEALLAVDEQVIALYEVNGEVANPDAAAIAIDLQTGETAALPIDPLNFRLTDVTQPDENGVFWAINYFFPGEEFLAVESDPLFEQFGMGPSQAQFDGYERLVPMRFTGSAVEIVDQPPVQLLMTEESRGRNWEGIAPLDDRGLLIVTDRYPATLLGFVPFAVE